MKHTTQSTLRKCLFFFVAVLSPFTLSAQLVTPSPAINAAPPFFPTAGQSFKKIYSGDLSITDAQKQPWYESYDSLYKKVNNNVSDKNITILLTKLQQNTITPDVATTQFQTAQAALKARADSVLSS